MVPKITDWDLLASKGGEDLPDEMVSAGFLSR
jgi:hypothetical protein